MNRQAILSELQCPVPNQAGKIEPQARSGADKYIENILIFNTDNDVVLTRRENEILRLVISGNTNKQIAKQLSRSERTVEFHRNRLMRKMAAHNAAELTRRAMLSGLI